MLHYQRTGKGENTLVLIHGFCENNTCFNKQVLFFKDLCTVITIDLPGFGKSQVQEEITVEKMADEVKNVLNYEQVRQCVLLGHSMGGYVTLAFAEKYSQMLKGFGLIHSTSFADNEERKEKRKQVISFIEQYGKEPYIRNFIPTLFKEPANETDLASAIQQGLDSDTLGIIEAAKAMMLRPDRTYLLSETNFPVFFAIGKYDQLIPEKAMFGLAAKCKTAHITYLHNSAHMGMMEEAEALNLGIQRYLRDLPNPQPEG